jgi:hypothetical protein
MPRLSAVATSSCGAPGRTALIAEAFVAVCSSYSQQLAIRGDLDPAPFTAALMAIIKG